VRVPLQAFVHQAKIAQNCLELPILVERSSPRCNAALHIATHRTTLQHNTTRCNKARRVARRHDALQHDTPRRNSLGRCTLTGRLRCRSSTWSRRSASATCCVWSDPGLSTRTTRRARTRINSSSAHTGPAQLRRLCRAVWPTCAAGRARPMPGYHLAASLTASCRRWS
jgi:hypothetical protein